MTFSSIKQARGHQKSTHPDEIHFLAALHEGPDLGAEFFPHAFQIIEHSQFLEGLVHLESGGDQGQWRKEGRTETRSNSAAC